jgi:hypothetical protein
MANAIWFAKWEQWQREEWERIFQGEIVDVKKM